MEEKYTTSSIYKFKDDRWRAQFPYLENGIWHKKTQLLEHRGRDKGRSHKHRDAAMLEAESIRASLNEKATAEAAKPKGLGITVSKLVTCYIDIECADVARSTATGYHGMLRRNIEPYLGDVPLEDLTEEDVQEWITAIASTHARSTACNSLRLLRGSLKYGMRKRGLLGKSPQKRRRELRSTEFAYNQRANQGLEHSERLHRYPSDACSQDSALHGIAARRALRPEMEKRGL